jgi:ribosome-associated protein
MSKAKNNPSLSGEFQPGEITFLFSRSSGPGGQNVNKVNTKVTLLFHLADCARFRDWEKDRIRQVLKNSLDKNDCVVIQCQQHRSQSANRKAALERLESLLQKALTPRTIRRKTKIPQGSVERRLRSKEHRSRVKRLRSGPGLSE